MSLIKQQQHTKGENKRQDTRGDNKSLMKRQQHTKEIIRVLLNNNNILKEII